MELLYCIPIRVTLTSQAYIPGCKYGPHLN